MSRFQQIKHPAEGSELSAIYREIVDAGWVGAEQGVPANVVTAFSERPDILRAMWAFTKGTLMSGVLPPTVKEMIAMTVAVHNDCRYCSVAHTNALEAMGVPTRVIESCARDPEFAELPPTQRALLKFALKAANDPKSVTDADFQSLRECGLSDGEITEVVMTVGCASFLDFFAEISGIAPDGEEVASSPDVQAGRHGTIPAS